MAHYALLDDNNVVTQVITGLDEDQTDTLPDGFSSWEEWYSNYHGVTCKRTSYNTYSNVHELDGTPFRGNYASLGGIYDETNDIFLFPKPYDSWILDVATASWKAPVDMPTDLNRENDTSLPTKNYEWNEETNSWDLVSQFNYNSETNEWELQE